MVYRLLHLVKKCSSSFSGNFMIVLGEERVTVRVRSISRLALFENLFPAPKGQWRGANTLIENGVVLLY